MDVLDLVFFTGFSLYFCGYWIVYTTFYGAIGGVADGLIALGIATCCVRVVFQHYTLMGYILLTVVISLSLVTTYVSQSHVMLALVVVVIAGRDIDVKRLARLVVVLTIALIFVVVLCHLGGFIPAVYDARGVGGIRSSLGFSHPNRLGAALFMLATSYAVAHYPRLKFGDALFYVGLSIIEFIVPNTRSVVILTLVVPVFIMLGRWVGVRTARHRFVLVVAFLLLCCATVASWSLLLLFDGVSTWAIVLNDLLSGRPSIIRYYWDTYPTSLFGQNVADIGVFFGDYEGVVIDNAYIRSVFQYGYLPGGLASLMCIYGVMSAFVKGVYDERVWPVILYGMYGLVESLTVQIGACFALVVIGREIHELLCRDRKL